MTRSNTTILSVGFLCGMASLPAATADVRYSFPGISNSTAGDDLALEYQIVESEVDGQPADVQVGSDLDAADPSNQPAGRADSNGRPLQGDSRRPLREAKSANERFELRIEAGRPKLIDAEPCKATLLDNETKRPVWERNLVNDVAPSFAAISDDGKFVITLDEFRRGGARNALVIYGAKGELLRHFLLQDLLRCDAWMKVDVEKGRAINWLQNAEYAFSADLPQFLLTLGGKSEVRIDLKLLRVMRAGGAAGMAVHEELPPGVAALLERDASGKNELDPSLALQVDALPDFANMSEEEIREFISEFIDENNLPANDPKLIELMQAITEETDMSISVHGNEGGDGAIVRLGSEVNAEPRTEFPDLHEYDIYQPGLDKSIVSNPLGREYQRIEIQAATDDSSGVFVVLHDEDVSTRNPTDTGWTFYAPYSGPKGMNDIALHDQSPIVEQSAVPLPNPQNPVDYVAWFNETTRFQGDPAADAAPLYKQALSNFSDFAGDSTAYIAALDGNADGLQTPEIQQWLESNREAMDQFREAARLPGRSFDYHSEDGSLIGILLPDLSTARSLVKGVAIEGKQLELAGRGDDAALAYLDIASAGAHQTDGATLIENLVGTAMQSLAADALMDLPAGPAGQNVDYAALAEQVEQRFQPAAPLADKINMERAMYLQTLQDMYMVDPDTGAQMIKPDKYQEFVAMIGSEDANPLEVFAAASQGMDKMVADGNRYYDRMVEAARMPYAEGRQQMDAIATELDQSRSTNPLLSQLVPALGKAHESTTRGEARRRAANLVTRLHAYKQQNGDYPDSLDVFGDSAFTIDPFTGGRFNYQKFGDQVRLYSEGEVQRGDANTASTIKPYWPRQK